MTELEVRGLAELERKLAQLGREIETELKPAVERALYCLLQKLPSYPEKPQPGAASRHWTARQRRWFFAALRARSNPDYRFSGPLLDSPLYKRRLSAGLGGSYSAKVESTAGAITGIMGTNMPYAQYVIGKEHQSQLHQGRWWIFEDEIEKNLPGAIRIIEDAVAAMLAEL